MTVAGIYASDDAAEASYIYSHLEFLQRRKGANLVETVTQFEILLSEDADPAGKCKEIDDMFRGGPIATDDLSQLIEMAHYLG